MHTNDLSIPAPPPIQVGHYLINREIGRGGMGEVFLAFDPICGRDVALKRMHKHLRELTNVRKRFLKEAQIASLLSHPSIIPIYSINKEGTDIFYTMPFVEGETIKDLLNQTAIEELAAVQNHLVGHSIPALMHIYLQICQAIASAHAKGFVHRDLKAENIILGQYGEVLILDWGLADHRITLKNRWQRSLQKQSGDYPKVPGTLSYLAPEVALGGCPSFNSDIYALGVLLYQLLTLKAPFYRRNLAYFQNHYLYEKIIDPQEMAPYRDIPQPLAELTKQMLHPDPSKRLPTAELVIEEIKKYLEGKSGWLASTELNPSKSGDWEFQEYLHLSRSANVPKIRGEHDWGLLTISRQSFPGNVKITTTLRFAKTDSWVGILFNLPEWRNQIGLEEGFCLWLSCSDPPIAALFRSNVEVLRAEPLAMHIACDLQVDIEKVDNRLQVFINNHLLLHYIAHVPMRGAHIGILRQDDSVNIGTLKIASGSEKVLVSCLAIPDVFFTSRLYDKALKEYRRIGELFFGRSEGREAIFRAGLTLIAQATQAKEKGKKNALLSLASEEFGKLHFTPAAPMEYLGKSLLYKTTGDVEEEHKCLDLMVRKHRKHPMWQVLLEHITVRLHEASAENSPLIYYMLLLSLQHIPELLKLSHNAQLVNIINKVTCCSPYLGDAHSLIKISLLLNKSVVLQEACLTNHFPIEEKIKALYALIELKQELWVEEHLYLIEPEAQQWLRYALQRKTLCHRTFLNILATAFDQDCHHPLAMRTILFLLYMGIEESAQRPLLQEFYPLVCNSPMGAAKKRCVALWSAWIALLESNPAQAASILSPWLVANLPEKSLQKYLEIIIQYALGAISLEQTKDALQIQFEDSPSKIFRLLVQKIAPTRRIGKKRSKNGNPLVPASLWEEKQLKTLAALLKVKKKQLSKRVHEPSENQNR